MAFNRGNPGILLRVILMFITLLVLSFAVLKEIYTLILILIPVIIFEVIDFYRLHKKAQDEVEQFVESVHYRDFSKYFNVKNAPVELQSLRQGFNEINTTFKVISIEKETQYQYLQKILELVDTGILSYETESGEVKWMNDAFKKIMEVPYLKTIHSLARRNEEIYNQILALSPGQRVISNIRREKNNIKVVLSATAFKTENVEFKLIAFQNVNEVLEETESRAWQKLLSVMTHEIMNSVAPISSLANTLQGRLKQLTLEENGTPGVAEDLELGIETIRKRSEGLLKFTETYRNLNKINKATIARVYVSDLFDNINRLMEPTLKQKNIDLTVILKDPLLTVGIDAGLIEQVLINLVLNSIDAVKSRTDPRIALSSYNDSNNKVIIKVTDNGTGMTDDVLDKIFVPFFSTKKNGNGIGLSLCKQIMMVHKGSITVQSRVNEGTAFYLCF